MLVNPFMKGMQLPVNGQGASNPFAGQGAATQFGAGQAGQALPVALKGVEGASSGPGALSGIKASDPSGTKFGAYQGGAEAVKGIDISKPNMSADGAVAAQFGGQFGEVAKRLNVFA